MISGRFNVVTDGQFGSTGKGAIASALAFKYRPNIISTTNWPNAGHTAVNSDGQKFIAKSLPSPTILNKWVKGAGYHPHILVGSAAAFTIEQLFKEIEECGITDNLTIHPRAGVVTEQHKQTEVSGSNSTKHIASTMQGSGAFQSDKIMRKADLKLARDYPELSKYLPNNMPTRLRLSSNLNLETLANLSLPETLNELMCYNYTILHEGSQGFSLDINHGHSYPFCTGRGTTAIQNMADMGISPNKLGDIYLVIRPYPIRVGNIVENGKTVGYSGDCYDDQMEITWEQVAENAGMPANMAAELTTKELTTVTKRLRRVYTFSVTQLREAVLINGATKIALNFANYIDHAVCGVTEYADLTAKVKEFVDKIENITNVPVAIIGTGPRITDVCWRS